MRKGIEMRISVCKGSALLIVLLILMIISMLATSLLNMTTIHTRIGAADDLHQAAYYFAEAGLQNQIELMVNYMEFLYRDGQYVHTRNHFYNKISNIPIQTLLFEPYKGQQVNSKITIRREGIHNSAICFTIYSSCTIANIKRTVKARVNVLWEDPQSPGFKLDKNNFYISHWGETYEWH